MKKLLSGFLIVTTFLLFSPLPVSAAGITRDATFTSQLSTNGATTVTAPSFTTGAALSNGAIYVLVADQLVTDNNVTGCTANGTSMTLVDHYFQVGMSAVFYQYILLAPNSSTSYSVVCSRTVGSFKFMVWAESFTGVKQTTTPDATTHYKISASGYSTSISTVTNGDWLFEIGVNPGVMTGGTNATVLNGAENLTGFDSNGSVSTGSITVTASGSSDTGNGMQVVAISPAATTAAVFNFWQFFAF